MATWTVKSQTDDLARALEIVGDQRAEGYTVHKDHAHSRMARGATFHFRIHHSWPDCSLPD